MLSPDSLVPEALPRASQEATPKKAISMCREPLAIAAARPPWERKITGCLSWTSHLEMASASLPRQPEDWRAVTVPSWIYWTKGA